MHIAITCQWYKGLFVCSQAVSTGLGTGKVKYITKEEALLNKDIEVSDELSLCMIFILFAVCHYIIHLQDS